MRGVKLCQACNAGNATRAVSCTACGAPFNGAKKSKADRPQTTLPARAKGNGEQHRANAMRQLGSGIVENALTSWALFRSVLDDQLEESTPLIQAAIDAHERALTLLQAGYQVAAT